MSQRTIPGGLACRSALCAGGGRCGVHVVRFPGQASQPGSLASLVPPWDSHLPGPPLRGNNETPVSPTNCFSFSRQFWLLRCSRAAPDPPCPSPAPPPQPPSPPSGPLLGSEKHRSRQRSPSQSYLKLRALTRIGVCLFPPSALA